MKVQLMLAARGGKLDTLAARLADEAQRCADSLPLEIGVATLLRLPHDPFSSFQPPMRVFDGVLELAAPKPGSAGPVIEALLEVLTGLGRRLQDCIHTDLCGAFAGDENRVVPPETTPYRYLYLMRRKADTTHAQYLRHYTEVHADFGRTTPATRGYEQLHLDEETSRHTARVTGLGQWQADSVSQLFLPSVDEFLRAMATSPVAREGPADEENFVDRPNSIGFCASVQTLRAG
jgi:hypothetical protein